MPFTNAERVRRTRARARATSKAVSADMNPLSADMVFRRERDGVLFTWTHDAGWRRIGVSDVDTRVSSV